MNASITLAITMGFMVGSIVAGIVGVATGLFNVNAGFNGFIQGMTNLISVPFILIMAWICPFLYLCTTLASILNGMGKTITTFWQNALSLLIRILFVWFAVPCFGITGYLWGLLVSQLFSAAAALFSLSRCVSFHFNSGAWIVRPALALGISAGIMYFFRFLLLHFEWKIFPTAEMFLSICVLCAVYIGIMFFSEIYILLQKKGILKA